jgi:hypothetical protein
MLLLMVVPTLTFAIFVLLGAPDDMVMDFDQI